EALPALLSDSAGGADGPGSARTLEILERNFDVADPAAATEFLMRVVDERSSSTESALRMLGRLGPAAARAAPTVRAILRDGWEGGTAAAAREALERVAPASAGRPAPGHRPAPVRAAEQAK